MLRGDADAAYGLLCLIWNSLPDFAREIGTGRHLCPCSSRPSLHERQRLQVTRNRFQLGLRFYDRSNVRSCARSSAECSERRSRIAFITPTENGQQQTTS